MRRKNNAKFAIEYAVLMAVAMAGLVGMAVYVKGGIAGRWREAGDVFGHGKQYDVSGGGGGKCVPTPCRIVCSGGGWNDGCGVGKSCPGGKEDRDDGCGGTCCCCCTLRIGSCS